MIIISGFHCNTKRLFYGVRLFVKLPSSYLEHLDSLRSRRAKRLLSWGGLQPFRIETCRRNTDDKWIFIVDCAVSWVKYFIPSQFAVSYQRPSRPCAIILRMWSNRIFRIFILGNLEAVTPRLVKATESNSLKGYRSSDHWNLKWTRYAPSKRGKICQSPRR